MSVNPERSKQDEWMSRAFGTRHAAARPGDVTPDALARIAAVEKVNKAMEALLDPPGCTPEELVPVGAARQKVKLWMMGLPTVQIEGGSAAELASVSAAIADAGKAKIEREALAAAKKAYEEAKAALEGGDLAKLPASAPAGLEAQHAAAASAKAALPADPKTKAEYEAGSQALLTLKAKLADYLKAATKKGNVDTGMSKFGSSGSKLADLTGHNTLNTLQKKLLDEALKKKFDESDTALSESELKALAQVIVTKTNKLAETPLEAGLPGVNASLAKSDTLKTNIVKLQQQGWTIKLNTPGGGSYCQKGATPTIAIDPSTPIAIALGGLAHETGHALFTPPTPPTPASAASGLAYVKGCVESNFIDEGEAQLVACRTTKELAIQGVASNVPADGGQFMTIYDQMVAGTIDEDTARKEMAKKFGNLVTSTTHESYLKYYGKHAITQWNAAHASEPAKQLNVSMLDTLVLFS